ncbi:UDP-glucuronosyl and UDP-glucosyl transferase [Handroanthus impetiginosus]|uniref:UDP-glucuronosyl and UDP-glucosyl transferase n=1 Tax=Handroanthus impetiginosus TaxID=429701 RepID=A0A2G9GIT9_9LAMI|nr:UDP-glucuronosyl and UDP-glucosyl transferase [Handroanthus impetiginosus]
MSPAPACVISDGIMSFAIDVAAELEIPAITFRTYSATCTWTTFHLQKLIQDGEIPVLEGSEDMDRLISNIPGLENIIRGRDLPSICRQDPGNPLVQFYIDQTSKMTKASALILNTFEELEAPIISHLHSIFPTVYAIGPLHTALKSRAPYDSYNSCSLLQIDQSCMDWLDSQPSRSVLYVSFGSVIVLTHDQVTEFWCGLVNSKKPFLWAIRPDLIFDENGPSKVLEELKIGSNGMGRVVGWAPQEDVLAHNAIGGFLTHSGWNSTLESISAGKPMICWPKIVDQQVNSRCVSEIWKVGLDMKDICDRSMVEKMVRDLMEGRREEIMKPTDEIARLARESVLEGGSSHRNIKKLIEDIKAWHSAKGGSKGKN